MAEADNLDEHKSKREKYGDGYSPNPHLSSLPHDFLYHLGLNTKDDDFEELFGDVKFIIMGGSPSRMKAFSEFLADRMKMNADEKDKLDISRTDRYHMFKIGPVLAISHGMGVPSVTILLHEIFKLLHYAKCSDVCLVRLGTCGGIGIPPGTVVVSKKVLNAKLKEEHDLYILGKLVSRQAKLDIGLAEEIVESQNDLSIKTVLGTTMCTDDFYEGQGRVDGALCDYSYQDRVDYIKKLKEAGVTNIEMEATVIGSLCNYVGIPGGIVCVSLLNRMEGDQVDISKEEYSEYQRRLQTVVANFIINRIARNK